MSRIPPKPVKASVPHFTLTQKKLITITRKNKGQYVKGRWVEGETYTVEIGANVQPFNFAETMKLSESDRDKGWVKVFSAEEIREAVSGEDGYEADRFEWNGKTYEVMKVARHSMSILDHFHALAVSIETSAQ